jgi:nucleoside-diphosphate-sugar epimerase
VILVTGGAGFVGRHVCALLSERGVEILAVDRAPQESAAYPTATGDLTDSPFLTDLLMHRPVDVIIHLASLLNTASRQDPQEALRVNVGASLKMIDLALRAGVTRFVYGSSISVYGTKRFADSERVSETAPAAPTDVYGITKRFVEIVGEASHRQSGLGFVGLRLPIVVGAGASRTSSPWRSSLFENAGTGREKVVTLPFRSDELIPLAHVEDVAAMISSVATAPQVPGTIYNAHAESWVCGDLAAYLRSLCKGVVVLCGQATVAGIPQALDSTLFTRAFGFEARPLKERLRAYWGSS